MAFVDINSPLVRNQWVREGLLQKTSTSKWAPYTGMTDDSVVYQKNDGNADNGHNIIFDYDGNSSSKAIEGNDKAFGKGVKKKKFSNSLTVYQERLVVDNGTEYEAVDIGDLSLSQHADSRSKLADNWIRFKDQMISDAAQGLMSQDPSHIIDLDTTFTWNKLQDIEAIIKTSTGFSKGDIRRPLTPFKLQNGEPVWLFIVDAKMANLLKKESTYQSNISQADIRGNDNRLISGIIAKIGSMLVVEMSNYFGETDFNTPGWGLKNVETEISGLRQYSGDRTLYGTDRPWTGQEDFDYADPELTSRGLIFGTGAVQVGMGKQPDYRFQFDDDFQNHSESALLTWTNSQKAVLEAGTTDYKQAKVADMDWGVIAVDVQVNA